MTSLSRRAAYLFDLLMGNVVGSNIFNIGGVFAVAGLLANVSIQPASLIRDLA